MPGSDRSGRCRNRRGGPLLHGAQQLRLSAVRLGRARRYPGNRGDQRRGRRVPASAQHLLVRRPVLHLHDLDGRVRLRLVAACSGRIVEPALAPGGVASVPRCGADLGGARGARLRSPPAGRDPADRGASRRFLDRGLRGARGGAGADDRPGRCKRHRNGLRPGQNARVQLHSVFITGLREASHHIFLGSGTGSDTNAARDVSGPSPRQGAGKRAIWPKRSWSWASSAWR